MKKSILSTITAVLVVVTSGIAQQELVVIEQGNRYKREKKGIRLNDNTSVIKFTPTQLLAGEINFSFEKQIGKQTSFEISAGPTISNVAVGDGYGNHYIEPIYGSYALEKSGLGFFTEVGYRFYPLDGTEALNRFYLSPVMKFKLMNFGLEDAAGQLPNRDGSDMRLNFAMNVGYQVWLSKSFAMDFYAGLGIGYQKEETYYPTYTYVGPDYISAWTDNSYTQARYVFNFGVKVGIGQEAK